MKKQKSLKDFQKGKNVQPLAKTQKGKVKGGIVIEDLQGI